MFDEKTMVQLCLFVRLICLLHSPAAQGIQKKEQRAMITHRDISEKKPEEHECTKAVTCPDSLRLYHSCSCKITNHATVQISQLVTSGKDKRNIKNDIGASADMSNNKIKVPVAGDFEKSSAGCPLGGRFEVALPPEKSEAAEQVVTTVLIVEDDSFVLEFMMKMIAFCGHRVIGARDGLEALTLWESERPHVVLMDVQMPKLDGVETTRMIRAREHEIGGQVPIYGLTAHSLKEDVNRCLDAGMTGHIGKPIDFKEVREAIRRHQAS